MAFSTDCNQSTVNEVKSHSHTAKFNPMIVVGPEATNSIEFGLLVVTTQTATSAFLHILPPEMQFREAIM